MNINEERKKNRELKRTINDFRQERLVFNGVFTRLEQELEKEKSRVDHSTTAIEAAYASRDKAQTLMRELSEEFQVEKSRWLKEWRELGAKLGATDEVQEATTVGNMDEFKLGELTLGEEQQLKSSLWKKLWGMGRGMFPNHLLLFFSCSALLLPSFAVFLLPLSSLFLSVPHPFHILTFFRSSLISLFHPSFFNLLPSPRHLSSPLLLRFPHLSNLRSLLAPFLRFPLLHFLSLMTSPTCSQNYKHSGRKTSLSTTGLGETNGGGHRRLLPG